MRPQGTGCETETRHPLHRRTNELLIPSRPSTPLVERLPSLADSPEVRRAGFVKRSTIIGEVEADGFERPAWGAGAAGEPRPDI